MSSSRTCLSLICSSSTRARSSAASSSAQPGMVCRIYADRRRKEAT